MSKLEVWIILFLAFILVGVFGLVLVNLVTNIQLTEINQYRDAPECNGTFPQQAGICKWSNHTWIVCKPATGYEADEHLRNMAWCEPVEFYDVRT